MSDAEQRDHGATARRARILGASTNPLAQAMPLVPVRGAGDILYDTSGRSMLDFDMLKNPFGHAHPRLAERLAEQARLLWEAQGLLSPLHEQVAARFLAYLPEHLDVMGLYASGSEAMEAALAMARAAVSPRRRAVLSLRGNYHGWTLGSLLAANQAAGARTRPAWLSPTLLAPPRNRDALPMDTPADDGSATLEAMERTLEENKSIGIFVAEPIQMSAGVRIPPDDFWRRARQILRAHDVFVIADEVSTGGWRIGGVMAAPELEPDVVCFGKTFGAGMGASVLATRQDIVDRVRNLPPARSNVLTAAVVLACLDAVDQHDLPARVAELSPVLMDGLARLREGHEWIRHARGRGLVGALDFGDDGATAKERALRVACACLEHGLRVALDSEVILIMPALTVTSEHLDTGLDILDAALVRESSNHQHQ